MGVAMVELQAQKEGTPEEDKDNQDHQKTGKQFTIPAVSEPGWGGSPRRGGLPSVFVFYFLFICLRQLTFIFR